MNAKQLTKHLETYLENKIVWRDKFCGDKPIQEMNCIEYGYACERAVLRNTLSFLRELTEGNNGNG